MADISSRGAHWTDRFVVPGIRVVEEGFFGDIDLNLSTNGRDRGIYPFNPSGEGAFLTFVTARGGTRQDFGAGPYSLRLIVDRQSEEKTEAATVTVGGAAVNASIGYRGDIDWFKVDLSPGMETSKTFRVDVRGLDTDGLTPADPFINLDGPAERGDSLENADGGEGGDARAYVGGRRGAFRGNVAHPGCCPGWRGGRLRADGRRSSRHPGLDLSYVPD